MVLRPSRQFIQSLPALFVIFASSRMIHESVYMLTILCKSGMTCILILPDIPRYSRSPSLTSSYTKNTSALNSQTLMFLPASAANHQMPAHRFCNPQPKSALTRFPSVYNIHPGSHRNQEIASSTACPASLYQLPYPD